MTSPIVSTLVQAGIRAPRPDLFLAADAQEGLGGVELVSIWCWGRPVLRGLPNPVSLTLACTIPGGRAQRSLNPDTPFFLN